MSISRSLNLIVKLKGYATFKSQMTKLQEEAVKLQASLSNMSVGIGGVVSNGNTEKLTQQFVTPLDTVIKQVKQKTPELQAAVSGVSNVQYGMGFLGGISNYANNSGKIKNIKQLPNVDPIVAAASKAAVESEAKIVALKAQQLAQGKQMAAQFHKMNQDRIDKINQIYKTEQEKITRIKEQARSLIQTGFGLHIMQIYLSPIIYALEQISVKMVSTFAEFDKMFTDYMVKSEEYGEWLSQSDFYSASVGQTYGITDAASAAERFAASGVDVAKSQKALTSVMQVATVAQMDYSEAANGVIRTMQAMHMQVQDVTVITDALINSANASTAELDDLVQWFEFAASSAYQAGLNVKELSAYLGILASTGTPNTGAAMRQLFLQLSKEDIRTKMKDQFSWINDESFSNVDQLILDMRNYVRSQDDQKIATREITNLLGGKANAQQALNNLLMSEPELWNQVMNAVNKTGSTQDLYNKITDNTADAIQRIKVNLDIWLAQLGEVVGPGMKLLADGFTALTKAFVALPTFIKYIIGAVILLATAFASVAFAMLGMVGAILIASGTLKQFQLNEALITLSTKGWAFTLRELTVELYNVVFATSLFNTTLKTSTVNTTVATGATRSLTATTTALKSAMLGIGVAMIGYTVSSSSMQKQMYSEAYVVGHLTALWLAYSAAKAAAVFGPVAAGAAAVAAFTGYEALMYNQIENMKRDARLANMASQIGAGSSKNYYINMDNTVISDDGAGFSDLIDSLEVSDI